MDAAALQALAKTAFAKKTSQDIFYDVFIATWMKTDDPDHALTAAGNIIDYIAPFLK